VILKNDSVVKFCHISELDLVFRYYFFSSITIAMNHCLYRQFVLFLTFNNYHLNII
jgi:hypothetical protein